LGVIGEAMCGLRHLFGVSGRSPVRVGVSLSYTSTVLHGAIGVLLAFRHRELNGGEGQQIVDSLIASVTN
ncbi:CoA transferase, partial [Pseudomonas syringae]